MLPCKNAGADGNELIVSNKHDPPKTCSALLNELHYWLLPALAATAIQQRVLDLHIVLSSWVSDVLTVDLLTSVNELRMVSTNPRYRDTNDTCCIL